MANGACLHIASATVEYPPPPPPVDGWTCPYNYYEDGECDCGCGALDIDCADATKASCKNNFCGWDVAPVPDENWRCAVPN